MRRFLIVPLLALLLNPAWTLSQEVIAGRFRTTGGGGGISLGVHAAAGGAAGNTVTTAAIAPAATGSLFYVCVGTGAGDAINVPTDSKGNVYTQIGTTFTTGGPASMARFYKANATGGIGLTVTATSPTGAQVSVWFVEVLGVTTLDQGGNATIHNATVSPYVSPSVTTTTAAEILLGCGTDDSTGLSDVFTAPSPFTILDQVTNGAALVTGADSYQIVAATSTYHSSFTTSQGTNMNVSIDTFH